MLVAFVFAVQGIVFRYDPCRWGKFDLGRQGLRCFAVPFWVFHFGNLFADGVGSTEVTRFDLGGKGVSCCPVLGYRVSLFPVPVGPVLNTVPFVFGGRFFGCEVLAIQGEKATKKAVFEVIY